MSRPSITAALLQRLYEREGLSATQIAKRFGSLPKSILQQLRRHGITVRPYRTALTVACDNCGATLRRPPSLLRPNKNHVRSHVFCNQQCRSQWQSKHPLKYGEGTAPAMPKDSFLAFVSYCGKNKYGNMLGEFICNAVGPPHRYRATITDVVNNERMMCGRCFRSGQANRPKKRPDLGKLPDDHKYCPGCNQVKARTEFYNGRRGRCKECSRKGNQEMTVKYTVDQWKGMSPDEQKRYKRCECGSPVCDKVWYQLPYHVARYCSQPCRRTRQSPFREDGKKRCTSCQQWKYTTEFNTANTEEGRLTSRCKRCLTNDTRFLKYGITVEEFEHQLQNQDGRCGFCHNRIVGTPHVDHDHNTGNFRGVLCGNCNRKLWDSESVGAQVSHSYLTAAKRREKGFLTERTVRGLWYDGKRWRKHLRRYQRKHSLKLAILQLFETGSSFSSGEIVRKLTTETSPVIRTTISRLVMEGKLVRTNPQDKIAIYRLAT